MTIELNMLRPGKTVCVSLEELFSTGSDGDVHVTCAGDKIVRRQDDDGTYYDLDNGHSGCACCDGEECEVKSVEGDVVTFVNRNQEVPQEFKLTVGECRVAIFGMNEGE